MKIEIYRKRQVFNGFVVDDTPETVFSGVCWFEIRNNTIFGNVNGEELTVKMDGYNYNYIILQ